MGPWHLGGIELSLYMLQDLVVFIAAILFAWALTRLYLAYGKPRALLILIIGVVSFVYASIVEMLYISSILPSTLLFNLNTPVVAAGIILSFSSIAYILRYLLAMAKVDPLTGIFNRRYFMEILNSELQRSARHNQQFVILYCDIDNLKEINDIKGHAIGDVVLRQVAQKLSENIRTSDVVARLGGDEFVILLTQTDQTAAQKVKERIDRVLSSNEIGKTGISISTGMVTYPEDGLSAEHLLNLADKRMYENKRSKQQQNQAPVSTPV